MALGGRGEGSMKVGVPELGRSSGRNSLLSLTLLTFHLPCSVCVLVTPADDWPLEFRGGNENGCGAVIGPERRPFSHREAARDLPTSVNGKVATSRENLAMLHDLWRVCGGMIYIIR
jgi:hypothetical protein